MQEGLHEYARVGQIFKMNMSVPPHTDGKNMYPFYVLATLLKSVKWCADFCHEPIHET